MNWTKVNQAVSTNVRFPRGAWNGSDGHVLPDATAHYQSCVKLSFSRRPVCCWHGFAFEEYVIPASPKQYRNWHVVGFTNSRSEFGRELIALNTIKQREVSPCQVALSSPGTTHVTWQKINVCVFWIFVSVVINTVHRMERLSANGIILTTDDIQYGTKFCS